jgi:tetratricopeptide (TPR) repeat protein
MAFALKCPRGHRWELTDGGAEAPQPKPAPCPMCGETCEVLDDSGEPVTVEHSGPSSSGTLDRQITVVFKDAPRPLPGVPDIPGYILMTRLGQGGMGVVYKAQQLSLNRPIALKMILMGKDANREQLIRFRIEAEALASLQHPNIVQIFEVGECNNCPFLSLEYVNAGNLGWRIRESRPSPETAARMTMQLARAMHAAHLRGIIHRDLKPGNILLHRPTEAKETDWNSLIPKITDFGLAKRLGEKQDQTQTGAILGTPCYMAPEQAQGDPRAVGPLADVYALGAILYEMLTTHPPFEGKSTLEIIDQVRTRDPVAPSRLREKMPRDLEVICLKCLEKEPGKRYASAEDLAKDLNRFLEGMPIQARRAGRRERLVKWAKRRPALAGLIALALGAVVAISGLTAWKVIGDHRAAEALRAENKKAQDRLKIAKNSVRDMRNLIDRWEDKIPDTLRSEVLDAAVPLYEDLAREESTDRGILREKAEALFELGYIYHKSHRPADAEKSYLDAIRIQDALAREMPEDEKVQAGLATTYNWLGELMREGGHRPVTEAEPYYKKALALQKDLAARYPNKAEYRRDEARSFGNLGLVFFATNEALKAEQHFNRSIHLLDSLQQARAVDCRSELAEGLMNRGTLRKARRQYDLAEADLRRAAGLLKTLHKEHPDKAVFQYNLALNHQNLGNLLMTHEKFESSLVELRRASALLDELSNRHRDRLVYRVKFVNVQNSLASCQAFSKQHDEAERTWLQSCDILKDILREQPKNLVLQHQLGVTWGNLGWLKQNQQKWTEAKEAIQTAIQRLRVCVAEDPSQVEYRQALRNQYQTLAEILIQLKDGHGAAETANLLAEVFPERVQDRYYAACFLARSIPLTQSEQSDRAARKALEHLRKVIEMDEPFDRVANEIEILRPLEARPDAQAVLTSLKKSK